MVVLTPEDRAVVLEQVGVAAVAYDAARRALEEAVGRAREQGFSWSEVGGVLGITRQAAFQRFGDRRRRAARDTPAPPAD